MPFAVAGSKLVRALAHFSSALAIGFLSMQTAYAGPEGGQVVRGEGSIVRPNATTTNINQSSHRIVIDWTSFNVASNETVNFYQPSSDAAALNRIFDQNPSQIFGAINANGRVLLVNPNGVLFGQSASVNVGSLIASGLDINSDAFMSGDWTFENAPGEIGGMVVNHGLLQAAAGGSISLFGGSVLNTGTILANYGSINLAAGERVTIDFDGDGLIQFAVDGEVLENAYGVGAAVSNEGTLQATSGQILMSAAAANDVFAQVVNNAGVISASGVTTDGGRVFLTGSGGDVVSTGSITATSDSGNGGEVRVLGDRVGLFGDAVVDVSGATAGGTALIGGDYQGGNGVLTSSHTVVGSNAIIRADAYESGNGGTIIVWADGLTQFFGDISAQGGAISGDGGFAEVSGLEQLVYRGDVNLLAGNGDTGTLLLDPRDIIIQGGSGASDGTFGDDQILFAESAGTDVTLFEDDLESASANIILEAENSITTSGTFSNISNGEATGVLLLGSGIDLTMRTRNNTGDVNGSTVTPGIDLSAITVQTRGDGSITLQTGNDGAGGGGSDAGVSAGIAVGSLITGNRADGGTGSITIDAEGDVSVNGAVTTGTISAGTSDLASGSINITSGGTLTTTVAGAITTGSVTVSGNGDTATSGGITLAGAGGVSLGAAVATGSASVSDESSTSGSISITSSAGAVATTAAATLTTGSASGDDQATTSGGVTVTGQTGVTLAGDVATGTATADDNAITTTSGTINITGTTGNVAVAGLVTGDATSSAAAGDASVGAISATATAGAVTLNGAVRSGNASSGTLNAVSGDVDITAGAGVISGAGTVTTGSASGDGNGVGEFATSGTITLNATGGGIQLAASDALSTGDAALNNDAGGNDNVNVGSISLTGDAISSDGATGRLDVSIGTGTVTFDATVNAGTLTANTGAGTGGIFITSGENLRVADLDTAGASAQTVDIATTGAANLTVLDMTETLAGDAISLGTATGTLTLDDDAFNTGTGSLTLTGDEVDLTGVAGSITGTGVVVIQQASDSVNATVGGAAADTALNITATDLAALADGFSGITLGSATATGTLTVDAGGVTFNDAVTLRADGAGGDVNVAGQITGSGNASVSLVAGDTVTLSANIVTAGNAVTVDATSIDLDDAALTVDTTNAGAVAAGAAIDFNTGAFTDVAGAASSLTLNAGTGGQADLVGGSLGGTLTVDANIINVNGALTIGGNADLDTSAGTGGIADNGAGSLAVAGTTTLDAAAAADIILDSANNNFDSDASGDAVTVIAGNNVTLVDQNAIVLGTANVSGFLDVTAGGAMTQTGALTVAGTGSFTTNVNDQAITLNNTANAISGAVDFTTQGTAANVTFDNGTTALDLGASTVAGNLDVTSGNAITQSGALTVSGTSHFTTDVVDQAITLANAANSFTGAVSFTTQAGSTASHVTVNGGAGTLDLGGSTVLGNLSATSAAITQNGALDVTGTAGFTASVADGDITLNTAGNDIDGAVTFTTSGTSGNVAFDNDDADASGTTINASTVNGTFVIDAANALTIAGTVNTTGGTMGTVMLTGGTNVSLADNAITAGASGVSVIASNGNIIDADTIGEVANITTTGQVSLTASGAVAGSIGAAAANEDIDLSGTTNLVLDADNDVYVSVDQELTRFDLTLTPTSNTYSISGATTITISDDGTDTTLTAAQNTIASLDFSLTTTSGNLLVADGAIANIGTGDVMLTTLTGNILDADAGADTTAGITTGGNLVLSSSGTIGSGAGLAALDVIVGGNTSLTSGGNINVEADSGTLTVSELDTSAGADTVNLAAASGSGAAITLNGSDGYVDISGDMLDIDGDSGTVTLGTTALTVGALDINTAGNVVIDTTVATADNGAGATGSIDIVATGAITGTGSLATGDATGAASGNISLTGASVGSSGDAMDVVIGSGATAGALNLSTTGGAGAGGAYVTSASALAINNVSVTNANTVSIATTGGSALDFTAGGSFTNPGNITLDIDTTGTGGTVTYNRAAAQTLASLEIDAADAVTFDQALTTTGNLDVSANGTVTVNAALATAAATDGASGDIIITTTAGGLTGTGGSLTTGNADDSVSGDGAGVSSGSITVNVAGAIDNGVSLATGSATDVTATTADAATAGSISLTADSIGASGNAVSIATGAAATAGVLDLATTGGTGTGGAFVTSGSALAINNVSFANANTLGIATTGGSALGFTAGGTFTNPGNITLDVDTTGAGGTVTFDRSMSVAAIDVNASDNIIFNSSSTLTTLASGNTSGDIVLATTGDLVGNAQLFTTGVSGTGGVVESGSITITADQIGGQSFSTGFANAADASTATSGSITLNTTANANAFASEVTVTTGAATSAGGTVNQGVLNVASGSNVDVGTTASTTLYVGSITTGGTANAVDLRLGSFSDSSIVFTQALTDGSLAGDNFLIGTGTGDVTFNAALTANQINVTTSGAAVDEGDVIVNGTLTANTGGISITGSASGGSLTGSGALMTADNAVANTVGVDAATTGSINVSVAEEIEGVSFATGNATVTGGAAGDTATSGSITLGASHVGTSGGRVAVAIGAADAGAGTSEDAGELHLATTGAAGTGDAYITSATDLELGSVATGGSADDIDVLVTGGNALTLTGSYDADGVSSLSGDSFTFNAQNGSFNGNGVAIDLNTGSLSVIVDNLSAGSFTGVQEAAGGISIAPFTANTTIGLGSGAGTFVLSDLDLDALVNASGGPTGSLSIGTAGAGGSGAVQIVGVSFLAGQTLTINTNSTINDDGVGVAFTGGTLNLNADAGIGSAANTLNIDADTLVANVAGIGDINVTDATALQLGSATLDDGISTADGSISITARAITTASVTGDVVSSASPTTAGGIVLTTTNGNMGLSDSLSATSTGDAITLETFDVEDGLNGTPAHVFINGQLTTAGGAVTVRAADGIAVNAAVNAGAGTVTLSANDTGNDTGTADTAGAVNGAGVITAGSIDLDAGSGIGNLSALNLVGASIAADSASGNIDINNAATVATTVTSLGTTDGTIRFDQTGGQTLDVQSATTTGTTGNNITITNDNADLALGSISTNSAGSVIANTTGTSGDIVVGSVNAGGNSVSLTSVGSINESAVDTTIDITGGLVTLTAANGIGGDASATGAGDPRGAIEISSSNLDVSVTAGNIVLSDVGGTELTDLDASGAINILSNGNLTIGDIDAGGAVTIDTDSGAINDATAGADGVTDITGSSIDLDATIGIGNLAALELSGATLISADTGSGAIDLDHAATAAAVVSSLSTDNATIRFEQTGGQELDVQFARTTNGGSITVNNENADLVLGSGAGIIAAGTVIARTITSGDVRVGSIDAGTNAVMLTSDGGAILDSAEDETTDITGGLVRLTAASGIGGAAGAGDARGALELAATNLDALVLGTGNAVLTEADGVIIDRLRAATGGISLVAAGTITDSATAIISATGNAFFDGSAITLGDTATDSFDAGTLTVNSAGSVAISEDSALQLAGTNTANSLTLSAEGTISDAASTSLTVTNNASFRADIAGTAQDITLGNDAGDTINFLSLTFDGATVSVTEDSATDLLGTSFATTLDLRSGGAITDTGSVSVSGTATLVAGAANNITLDNAANDFGTVVVSDGVTGDDALNVTLADIDDITLGNAAVAGTYDVTATAITFTGDISANALDVGSSLGPITQTGGSLDVATTATFAAQTSADITIDQAGNDFGTVTITSGRNVDVVDANALVLGTSTVSGTLDVATNGTLTQSGALIVGGTATLTAGAANSITLDNVANDFETVVVSDSVAGNDALNVTLVDVDDITLGNAELAGTYDVTASAATLTGAISTNALDIDVSAGLGAINQTGGSLLDVVTTATFAAQTSADITIDQAGNDFGTVTITSGRNVDVADVNALVLGTSTVSGTLDVATNGTLTQSGALSVAGTTTLTAGAANSITLDDVANDFETVVVSDGLAGNDALNVTLVDVDDITLANAVLAGTYDVTADAITLTGVINANALDFDASTGIGAIIQTGGTLAATTATFRGGATDNVSLDQAGNDFGTVIITNAQNVLLRDVDDLALGTSTIAGTLNVTTGGALTDSGALIVTGATTLTAGANDIALDNLNNFSSITVNSADDVTLNDINALTLTSITATGAIDVIAGGLLTATGVTTTGGADTDDVALQGTSVAVTTVSAQGLGDVSIIATTGAITDSGSAVTGDTVDLDASTSIGASGNVINTTANRLDVTTTTGDAFVLETDGVTLGTVNVGNNFTFDNLTGDILIGSVDVDGALDLEAQNGSIQDDLDDLDADIMAGSATLTASGDIGGNVLAGNTTDVREALEINAGTLTLDASNVVISDLGAAAVTLSFNGDNFNFQTANDILVDAITATNDVTLISSGGSINDSVANPDTTADISAGGSVSLEALGEIGGTAHLDISSASLSAVVSTGGAGDIVLNDLGGTVLANITTGNGNIDVTSDSSLELGTLSASGAVDLDAAGALTDANGDSSVSGTAVTLTAATGIGTATGAINTTATSLDLDTTSNGIYINETDGVDLVAVDAPAFTLTAGGDVTDSGALIVTGVTTLTAGANDVVLDTATNDFGTVAITSGNNVTVEDVNALALGASDVSGNLTVTVGGTLTQSGALNVDGATDINAAGQTVTLDNTTNTFTGAITTDALGATLTNATATNLGASNIGAGGLVVNSGSGTVTQTGALTVTGTTAIHAATQTVTLTGLNNFTGAVSGEAATFSVRDINAIALGDITATTLNVTASGNITDSGDLDIAGVATLSAGSANDIMLDGVNNDFGTVAITSGNDVTIDDIGALALGASTVSGNLVVTVGGDLTQSAAVNVTGTTDINAAGQTVTLSNTSNVFTGAITMDALGATLTNNTATNLGVSNIGAGGLVVNSASGNVTQSGVLTVTGATDINAAGRTVTLLGLNNFTGAVSGEATTFSVNDINAIALGDIDATTLNVTANGNVTDSGTLAVTGVTTVAAGAANDIVLDNANSFGTVAITSGNNVTVRDANALVLGASDVSGNLVVTVGGTLTQSGALDVTGTTDINAAGQTVDLSNGTNTFTGAITTDALGATLTNDTATNLGASNIGAGGLVVNSGSGAVTQTGALTVTGTTAINAAAQTVTLTGLNNFTGAVSGAATTFQVRDINAIVLGDIDATTLNVIASGDITGSGAIDVTGTTTLTAGALNDIALTGANDFGTVVIVSGNDVSLVDIDGITLGNATVGGIYDVTADSVTLTGTIGANALDFDASTGAGAINQTSGTLTIASTSAFTVAAGDDVLLGNANDFGGAVSVAGGADVITLNDINGLVLGGIAGTTLNATANGDITDAGAGNIVVGGVTTLTAGAANDITLSGSNNFGTVIITSADNATLVDTNGITLGNANIGGLYDVTATGMTLTGAINAGSVDFDASIGAGAINQTGGSLVVTGTATFAGQTTDSITLNQAGNDFSTVNVARGGNITFRDADAIVLGTLEVSGTLGVTANGAITDSGVLDVDGAATLAAGNTNDVQLDSANDFASVVVTSANDVLLNDTGALTLTSITATGAINVTAAGALTATSVINTNGTDTGDINLEGTSIAAGTITANGAGDVNLAATAGSITDDGSLITADDFTFSAVGAVGGTSALNTSVAEIVLGRSTAAGDIRINETDGLVVTALHNDNGAIDITAGGAITTANVTATGAFSATGSSIVIGGAGLDVGAVNLDATTTTVNIAAAIDSTGTVNIDSAGLTTITAAGDILAGGAVTFDGALQTSGDITTSADAIVFNDTVTLATDVAFDTTNGGLNATGALIDFDGTLSGAHALALEAGNGAVSFATINGLTGIVVDAGSVSFGGPVTLGSGGLDVDASGAVTFGTTATTSAVGAITIDNGGLLTLGADMNLQGTFMQTGAGATNLNADIVTTNDAVSFSGAVNFTGDRSISTGSGAGAISMTNGVTGSGGSLTLDAGTDAIALGDAGNIGTLDLDTSGVLTLSGDIDVATFDAAGLTGRIDVDGAASIATANTGVNLASLANGVQAAAGGGGLAIDAGTAGVTLSAVGSTTALDSLSVSGGTITSRAVNTSGAQTYNGDLQASGNLDAGGAIDVNGDVTLAQNVTFDGSLIDIGGAIDGAHALTLTATGAVNVGGGIGQVTALDSLAVNAGSATVQTVTTTQAQTYSADVSVNGNLTGGSLVFNSDVVFPGDVIVRSDTIDFLGGTSSVTGGGELTLIPFTDGADVDFGGTSGTLNINSDALQGYDAGLVIGGIFTENGSISITTVADEVTLGGDFSVGADGYIIVVSRSGIDLQAGTISAGSMTLIAADPAGNILNVASRASDSLLQANDLVMVAGGQIGDANADINAVSLSTFGRLEVGSGADNALVSNIGNSLFEDKEAIRAQAIADALGIVIGPTGITSNAQNSANREQSGGLANEGFIDPSLFEDIALYEVSGSGISLPADQSEEEVFDEGPSADCNLEEEDCDLGGSGVVGAISPD